MIRGGEGISQNVIFDDQGGGVQTPHKKHDIINEQPLRHKKSVFAESPPPFGR